MLWRIQRATKTLLEKMYLRLLRVTWFHFYDELGRNLLVNFLAVAACLVPLPVLGIPVSLCAISAYANRLARFQDPGTKVFFEEYRRFFWRGLKYGWFYFAVFIPLATSLWFYIRHSEDLGLLGYALAGICFWTLLFYGAMGFYFFPLLVHQEQGLLTTLKRSALAVLARPMSVGIGLIVWLLWIGIGCVIQPLLFVVPLIWLALSGNVSLLFLLDEYSDEVPDV
ncbi:MAG: DUF624 domain-containing protein [bacterium]